MLQELHSVAAARLWRTAHLTKDHNLVPRCAAGFVAVGPLPQCPRGPPACPTRPAAAAAHLVGAAGGLVAAGLAAAAAAAAYPLAKTYVLLSQLATLPRRAGAARAVVSVACPHAPAAACPLGSPWVSASSKEAAAAAARGGGEEAAEQVVAAVVAVEDAVVMVTCLGTTD